LIDDGGDCWSIVLDPVPLEADAASWERIISGLVCRTQVVCRVVARLEAHRKHLQVTRCSNHATLLTAIDEELQRLASQPPQHHHAKRQRTTHYNCTSISGITINPPCLVAKEDLKTSFDMMDGMSSRHTQMGLLQRLQHLILHLCPSLSEVLLSVVIVDRSGTGLT